MSGKPDIYIYVLFKHLFTHFIPEWAGSETGSVFDGVHLVWIFLLKEWFPYWGERTLYVPLFTRSLWEKEMVHVFPKGICLKWNVNNLVWDLNSFPRSHFLRRKLLSQAPSSCLDIKSKYTWISKFSSS